MIKLNEFGAYMRYLNLITLLGLLALGYMLIQSNNKIAQLEQSVSSLEKRYQNQELVLNATQQQLALLQSQSKDMESRSLKGLAEKANGALFKGLEDLLNSVGDEVQRAKENIEKYQQPDSNDTSKNSSTDNSRTQDSNTKEQQTSGSRT
jgi:BMFP domain-containing protein YqiC